MDTPMLVGRALRHAGCSRAELARRAGIAQSVLSAYEHGRRDPTVASLNRVLAAAGLSLTAEPALAAEPALSAEPALAAEPRRQLRVVDSEAANRELQDVLSFVDALPFSPRVEPLAYPVFARR